MYSVIKENEGNIVLNFM